MFAGILLPIRSISVMDLMGVAGFDSPCLPIKLPGIRRAQIRAHTYEVHIFNERCGPLKLESASAGTGSDWVSEPVPYINPGLRASFAVASTSDEIAASATVTYRDILSNATITFKGTASGLAGASHSQATGNGDLVADGPQGSFLGRVPRVEVDYSVSCDPQLSGKAPRSPRHIWPRLACA